MLFDTVLFKVVLERAIETEEQAFRFYSDAALQAEDPGVKKLLKKLAGNELKHRMKLEKLRNSEKYDKLSVPENIYPSSLAEEAVKTAVNTSADLERVLTTAAEMERAAAAGYTALAEETKRPVLEHLFSELAAEENRHVNALERQLTDLRT